MKKILCICLSTTIQRTITFKDFTLEKVNRSQKYRQDASGKTVNTARVLNQLEEGCSITICPVGEKNRALFEELAERDNLAIQTVAIPGFTRECWTLLDGTAGTTTEVVVGEPKINESCEKQEIRLLKMITEALKEVDAVVLAGSRPEIWSNDLYATIAGIALDNKKLFLADYHGADLLNTIKTCTPSIIKINEEEFLESFAEDDSPLTPETLKKAITEKSRQLNNMIIVTRGTDPTFAANQGTFVECPIEKVNALNTTACGDSFNAGFIHEYLKGSNFEASLKKGTWCAARNAENECPGAVR